MGTFRGDLEKRQHEFFSAVKSPIPLLALIDHMPATYFFAKDKLGRFVHMNRALLEVLGLPTETEVWGKTDADLFVPEVADRYRDQDQQVMTTRKPVVDHVCGVPDATGLLRWYVETKIPLIDEKDEILGIAGIMHDLEKAGATLAPYQRLTRAITHINNCYAEKISVQQLAELVHLSISQFNRTFKRLFKITPAQYITRVRINAACTMLRSSSKSVERIASRTGFYDASHFVRLFKKEMQLTPRSYREQWVDSATSQLIETATTPRNLEPTRA
ncbi:MAG: AraC family transcriptional regulator [Lacipirellulaceae bacterium]